MVADNYMQQHWGCDYYIYKIRDGFQEKIQIIKSPHLWRFVFTLITIYGIMCTQQKKEVNMKTLEKILSVLVKNLGYTVVLVLSIILFAMFADGLISGIITAVSALLAYACIMALYNEFKKEPAKSTKKK